MQLRYPLSGFSQRRFRSKINNLKRIYLLGLRSFQIDSRKLCTDLRLCWCPCTMHMKGNCIQSKNCKSKMIDPTESYWQNIYISLQGFRKNVLYTSSLLCVYYVTSDIYFSPMYCNPQDVQNPDVLILAPCKFLTGFHLTILEKVHT